MKASEVESALTNLADEDGENPLAYDYGNAWSAIGHEDYSSEAEEALKALPFSFTVVENYGGGEGSGETRYLVLQVTSDDGVQYFRKDGAYYSYDGSNWDYGDFYEVEPTQKTITVYPRKKGV